MIGRRIICLIFIALLLPTACGEGASGTAAAGDQAGADATADVIIDIPEVPVVISNLLVIAHPANTLAAYVEWETNVRASSAVAVDCGEDHQALVTGEGTRREHSVFVMGLFDGAACTFTATSTGGNGSEDSAAGTFTAGPLPENLPAPELKIGTLDVVQPGWTLFNLSNTFDNVPLYIVLVDSKGRYRWFHQRSGPFTGLDTDLRATSQGISIGGVSKKDKSSLIDWEGHILWEGDYFNHHEFLPVPGKAGRFFGLTTYKDGCGWGYDVQVMIEHDLETHTHVWEWVLCEHWEPPVIGKDWSHLNTIDVFPGGDALILSSRQQNTLFKISYPEGEFLWALGQAGDFAFDSDMDFFHQHAPEITPDGTILLFDNGLHVDREWSRALEFSYDLDTMTAEKVWEYRPEPDIYAPVWGDSDRLPNGDTLVVFGRWDAQKHSHIIEVNPAGTEVWHLVLPKRWGVYRAQRFVDPPAGHVLTN